MKLTIETKSLRSALDTIKPAIDKKHKCPILQNVLFDANTITATDLEVGIVATLPAAIEGDPITLPHEALSAIVKKLPKNGTVTIETAGETATVSSDGISATLPTMAKDSYPELPTQTVEAAVIDTTDMVRMIRETRHAISREASRFTLNGALLELSDESAKMVTTDGHRLALATATAAGYPSRRMLPTLALDAIAKTWAKATGTMLTIGSKYGETTHDQHGKKLPNPIQTLDFTFITDGSTTIVTRNLAGTFPDYERIMPRREKQTAALRVNRTDLLASVERVGQFADKRSHCIKLTVNGHCKVWTAVDGVGCSADVPATWNGPEDYNIGLSAVYLADWLKSQTVDSVEFAMSPRYTRNEDDTADVPVMTQEHAVLMLGDSDAVGVLMPMCM